MKQAALTRAESRFFRSADGLRLHYLLHPCLEADSPRHCVLLHGFTNDAHVWDPLAAQLQSTHHVWALDHRGHGDSDHDPQQRYSHWQLADDVRQFLRDVVGAGTDSVQLHVAGHSLGARVAMLALAAQPTVAASLTVLDAGPEVHAGAAERLLTDVMAMPRVYARPEDWVEALTRTYVMADPAEIVRLAAFALRRCGSGWCGKTDPAFFPGIWHRTPELQRSHADQGTLSEQLWRAWRSLRMPVHLLRGQASSILEQGLTLRMVQALEGRAILTVVPRAGHALMLDNPMQCRALVCRFILDSEAGGPAVQQSRAARKAPAAAN